MISRKNKVGILYDDVIKKVDILDLIHICVFMTLDDVIRFPRNIRMNIRNSSEALY